MKKWSKIFFANFWQNAAVFSYSLSWLTSRVDSGAWLSHCPGGGDSSGDLLTSGVVVMTPVVGDDDNPTLVPVEHCVDQEHHSCDNLKGGRSFYRPSNSPKITVLDTNNSFDSNGSSYYEQNAPQEVNHSRYYKPVTWCKTLTHGEYAQDQPYNGEHEGRDGRILDQIVHRLSEYLLVACPRHTSAHDFQQLH